jgi:hypothetical protein
MRLRIVQVEKLAETSLSVYLSDGSTVEVTLDDLIWIRSQNEEDADAKLDLSKWN